MIEECFGKIRKCLRAIDATWRHVIMSAISKEAVVFMHYVIAQRLLILYFLFIFINAILHLFVWNFTLKLTFLCNLAT